MSSSLKRLSAHGERQAVVAVPVGLVEGERGREHDVRPVHRGVGVEGVSHRVGDAVEAG